MKVIGLPFLFVLTLGLANRTQGQAVTSSLDYDGKILSAKETKINGKSDEVLEGFRGFLRAEYKVKSSARKGVLTAKEILLPGVIEKKGDLIAMANETGKDEVTLRLAYLLGYDVFLSEMQNPDDFEALAKPLNRFEKWWIVKLKEAEVKALKKQLNEKKKLAKAEEKNAKQLQSQAKDAKKGPTADATQADLLKQKAQSSKDLASHYNSQANDLSKSINALEKEIKDLKQQLKK